MKSKKGLVAISLLLIILAVGITSFKFIDKNKNTESLESATEKINITYDYKTAEDLTDMVHESDYIVLGVYEKFDSTWNLARNPDDLSKESEEEYIEGKIYNFKVEEVLSGDIKAKNIQISHMYEETIVVEETSGDEEITPEGILVKEPTSVKYHEVKNPDPAFIEPNFGEKYIVFLSKDEINGVYMGSIEPYLIKVDENELVNVQSNLLIEKSPTINTHNFDGFNVSIESEAHIDFKDSVTGEKLDEIIKQIKKIK